MKHEHVDIIISNSHLAPDARGVYIAKHYVYPIRGDSVRATLVAVVMSAGGYNGVSYRNSPKKNEYFSSINITHTGNSINYRVAVGISKLCNYS